MSAKVLVIIPAYKNPDQLEICQKAVLNSDTDAGISIFIVENSDKNIGFTAAINQGLRKANIEEYEFAIALNQDCYLEPDAIENIVRFMREHDKCAIAGIKQLSSQDPDQIICGGVREAYPYGRHITGLVSKGECADNKQMPWANGACMVFRVSMLIEFGLMDENMFLIGSDSDICFRARYAGYQVWYIADAVCIHEQGVSARQTTNDKVERIKYLDMVYFRNKWFGTDLFRELSMEIFV